MEVAAIYTKVGGLEHEKGSSLGLPRTQKMSCIMHEQLYSFMNGYLSAMTTHGASLWLTAKTCCLWKDSRNYFCNKVKCIHLSIWARA